MGNYFTKVSSSGCKDGPMHFYELKDSDSHVLQFEPLESRLLAFTVQSYEGPYAKTFCSIDKDAQTIASALSQKGVIPFTECHFYAADAQPKWCKFDAMESLFKKYAGEVGSQGVFVFFFSGYGIYDHRGEFAGLAPKDYDGTVNTWSMCITREVLKKWLKESKCKAKYVLFIINSCYTGRFKDGSSSSPPVSPDTPPDDLDPPLVYVMFSSTSDEASSALQCSVFCHSLSRAINRTSFSQGHLPIRDIANECRVINAFANTRHAYKGKVISKAQQHSEVKWAKMAPKEEVDFGQEPLHLVKECLDWIEECEAENGPLDQLRSELLNDQCNVDTVLCFMLRSILCIQLSQEPGAHVTIADVNFFEIVYKKVVDTLEKYTELKFEKRQGLNEYIDCLKESGITEDRLSELTEMLQNIQI